MKKIFILLLLFPLSGVAQQLPDFGFDKIKIITDENIIQAQILPVEGHPEAKTDRFYYWYNANKVHQSKGGYSGILLNGYYNEYFLDRNLKIEGHFVLGLKDGIWKEWSDNGMLILSEKWKKGLESGFFYRYDETGRIIQSGNYKNGLLNGKVKQYFSPDSVVTIHYKNGEIKKPEMHNVLYRLIHFHKIKRNNQESAIRIDQKR